MSLRIQGVRASQLLLLLGAGLAPPQDRRPERCLHSGRPWNTHPWQRYRSQPPQLGRPAPSNGCEERAWRSTAARIILPVRSRALLAAQVHPPSCCKHPRPATAGLPWPPPPGRHRKHEPAAAAAVRRTPPSPPREITHCLCRGAEHGLRTAPVTGGWRGGRHNLRKAARTR